MPMKKELYPSNWKSISLAIRDRAKWKCEECGKPCRRPNQSWDEFHGWLISDVREPWFEVAAEELPNGGFKQYPTRFTLTVAHLDGNPVNCEVENLKALCAPYHLRHDVAQHVKSRKSGGYTRKEKLGQLTLF